MATHGLYSKRVQELCMKYLRASCRLGCRQISFDCSHPPYDLSPNLLIFRVTQLWPPPSQILNVSSTLNPDFRLSSPFYSLYQ